ncbi:MAG: hypothetical protein Q8L14_04950 [Myxococcales bacterium]|nr:hypothetical protein [Myxococcales bacterium]
MRHVLLLVVFALPAFAQQSFFNVPSGTRTTDHHIFLQAQFNVGPEGGESNFTAATGIAGGLELGFNIFHVDLFGDAVSHSARNLFMANAVYTRELLHWLSFQVGAQAGIGRFETDGGRYDFAGFGWGLARFDWHEARLAGVVGGYAGTASHLGPGWPAGPMAAVEWTAIEGWLALQADLVFGNHESAVAVVGAALLLPWGWQLSAGAILPSPLSHNAFGLCVELTRVPEFEGPPRERLIRPMPVRN